MSAAQPRPPVGGSLHLSPQPGFAGIATFLRGRQGPVGAIPRGAVAVTGIPIDGFADTAGTAEGPRGIREASVAFLASLLPAMHGALVDVETERRLELAETLPLIDVGDLDPLDGPSSVASRVAAHAASVARDATLAVFLGGTRAISAPLLAGVASARHRRPALLRLGATLDLGEEPPDRPLAPGASLAVALREGAPAACLGPYGSQPAVEWRRADERGLAVTPLADWRRRGLAQAAGAAAETLLRHADELYLSIDLRVVDGAFAAGRGRVVSGGLLPEELLEVADALAPFPVAAVDLVEVAPPLDSTRRAEHLAFRALLAILLPRLGGAKAAA
jgi:arginase family enzyme